MDVIIIIVIAGLFEVASHSISKSNSYEYQYLKRNYDSQSTDYGIVSQSNIIKENEYLSYRDDQGNNILISNFGENEYECLGSCFCEDSERKVSTVAVSKRILSYLLVSISSIIALEKAKRYFDSKCIEELYEECHLSSIKSSVEDCSSVVKEEKEKEEESIEDHSDVGNEEKRVFFCYGSCLFNQHLNIRKSTLKQFERIKCDKMKREGEIVVKKSDLIVHDKYKHQSTKYQNTAVVKFVKHFLTDFCKRNSRLRYSVNFFNEGNLRKERRVGSGCVGKNSKGNLGHVHCRLIYPEPRSPNRKWQLENWNKKKEVWDLI